MNEIVVLGASGFIGRHFCETIASADSRVLAVSRHPAVYQNKFVIPVCVIEYRSFVPPSGSICLHLAGESNIGEVAKNPNLHRNLAIGILESVFSNDYSKIILGSSSAVYGDYLNKDRLESESIHPEGAYACLKRDLEELTENDARGVIARFANVYGPGMKSGTIFSDIAVQARNGTEILLRDTTPIRDYVHVFDVVSALFALANGKISGVFNVSSGEGISVMALAERLCAAKKIAKVKISGKNASVKVSSLVLSNKKMRKYFNWTPKVDLAHGLEGLRFE